MGLEKIASRLLEDIRSNGGQISAYANGMDLLEQSKVLELLKLLFRPQNIIQADDPQASMSIAGAYAAGANDLLETLVHFKELYLEALPPPSEPKMTFNSIETNLKNGNITEEEANAIRNNTKPDYSKYYSKPAGNTSTKPV